MFTLFLRVTLLCSLLFSQDVSAMGMVDVGEYKFETAPEMKKKQ